MLSPVSPLPMELSSALGTEFPHMPSLTTTNPRSTATNTGSMMDTVESTTMPMNLAMDTQHREATASLSLMDVSRLLTTMLLMLTVDMLLM